MWIETSFAAVAVKSATNSFASNGECGLKRYVLKHIGKPTQNSFASNGECGLKQASSEDTAKFRAIHSPAMANVD